MAAAAELLSGEAPANWQMCGLPGIRWKANVLAARAGPRKQREHSFFTFQQGGEMKALQDAVDWVRAGNFTCARGASQGA